MVKIEPGWLFEKASTKFNNRYDERYYLTAKSTSSAEKEQLFVLMMNPSHAGCQRGCLKFSATESDLTINLLLRTIGKGYKKVTIFNVVPLVESSSKKMRKMITKSKRTNFLMTKNRKNISIFLNKNTKNFDLFIGTGDVSFVNNFYIQIMKLLTAYGNVYFSSKTSTNFSAHPKPIGGTDDLCEFVLNSGRKPKIRTNNFKIF